MALALYDRVKETTTVTGTGTATLLGATTGFQSFAVVGNANTTYYCIADQGGANWEVGIGTYTASGTTLARTTVLSSSNADALVAFTAGIKDVFVTYPSSKGLWKDASGNAIGLGTPAAFVGTNITGTASGLTAGNVTTNANLTGAITSTGNATSLGSFTSLQLATALTDETGSGSAVFATSPTLVTPVLGTPASGVVTNLTGTASININGTVGATTATTGAFTNLSYTGTLTGSTGVLNIGSGQVYKDASGNVGIGTNSPQTRLTIQDTGSGANIGMMVRNGDAVNFHRIGIGYNAGASTGYIPANAVFVDGTGGGGYGALGGLAIGTGSSAPVIFGTNATPRMRIDPSGNVGIGTSSPSSYGKLGLSVSATASAVTNVIGFQNSAGVDAASLRIAGYNYVNNVQTAIDFIQNSASNFQSQMSFSTHSGASLLERMRIDSSGNVGIGTTNPAAKLDLGTGFGRKLNVYNDSNAISGFGTDIGGSTYELSCYSGGNGTGLGTFTWLGYNRTTDTYAERMRIDSSGNVGIGTTAAPTKLTVYNATDNSVPLSIQGSTSLIKDYGPSINFQYQNSQILANIKGAWDATGSGAHGNLIFSTRGAEVVSERMRINSSGIVTMSAYGAGAATFSAAGVISSVSDETWKIKDGVPVDADSMLKNLEPGYWYYNDEKAPIFGTDRQLGFYAQNVNAAIGPEAAPTPEEGKPWGYYDRSVLAVTVLSLQKALATIEELTARLTKAGL